MTAMSKSSATLFAFCWANGAIEFGPRVPKGAIAIAYGVDEVVRRKIAGTSRLAYDNKTFRVPGVYEARDPTAAIEALISHCRWLRGSESAEFRVAEEASP